MNLNKIFALSIILSLVLLAGCSTTPEKKLNTSMMPIKAEPEFKTTPGSIWTGINSRNRFFSDFRARDVGDIITVTILERTTAKKEASTDTGSSGSESSGVTSAFGMPLDFGLSNFANLGNKFSPSVGGNRDSSFAGSGSTERKGEITATISVRVIEVLSNGNLFVEGRKETKVNREEQFIILSGVIRPEDVSSFNTVSSDYISDLNIELSGYGVIASKQKPGWLGSVLDDVWPF